MLSASSSGMMETMARKQAKRRSQDSPSESSARSKHKGTAVDPRELPKESDESLRLMWFDTMNITSRGDIPVVTLRFHAALGDEKLCEVCRLQTGTMQIKSMVDVFCRVLDYYPEKPNK